MKDKRDRKFVFTTSKQGVIDFYEKMIDLVVSEYDFTRGQAASFIFAMESVGGCNEKNLSVIRDHFNEKYFSV